MKNKKQKFLVVFLKILSVKILFLFFFAEKKIEKSQKISRFQKKFKILQETKFCRRLNFSFTIFIYALIKRKKVDLRRN